MFIGRLDKDTLAAVEDVPNEVIESTVREILKLIDKKADEYAGTVEERGVEPGSGGLWLTKQKAYRVATALVLIKFFSEDL